MRRGAKVLLVLCLAASLPLLPLPTRPTETLTDPDAAALKHDDGAVGRLAFLPPNQPRARMPCTECVQAHD